MIHHTKNGSVRPMHAERFFLKLFLCATALSSCHSAQQPTRLFGKAQGTYYSISYFDPQGRDLQPKVDSLLDAFDQTASLWVDNSLLRRLNANETDSVNPLFEDMFNKSFSITKYTDGAFDPRIGRIVQAWGFSFKAQEEPDSTQLAAMLEAAHAPIHISEGRLIKENSQTELDFNAIAQGYSVDLLAAMFDTLGVKNYLIDVGGEVIARGGKPDGTDWRVGIEQPAKEKDNTPEVLSAVKLRDASIVTSGNYRKYYERDGVRYSHTINPTTGRPVQHTLLSASVIAPTAWEADAMATAYMVMGLDSALSFIRTHKGSVGTEAVFFIYDDNGETATYSTAGMEQILIK